MDARLKIAIVNGKMEHARKAAEVTEAAVARHQAAEQAAESQAAVDRRAAVEAGKRSDELQRQWCLQHAGRTLLRIANAVAELGFQTIPQTGALVFSCPSWRRSVHRIHSRRVQRRWGMLEALFTAAQCRRSRSIKPMRHAVNCRARRARL